MSTRSHRARPRPSASTTRTRPDAAPWVGDAARTLLLAAFAGGLFGFLLQKGGVAKFDILIGALLLENFVVVKVMLSAIAVGMVGLYVLRRTGAVDTPSGETVYGRVLVGGLVFGVGFGLLAYCPGTDAAALGQGNLDAWTGVAGMLAGSYAFARCPQIADAKAIGFGRHRAALLPDLLGIRQGTFLILALAAIIAVLVLLEMFAP